MGRATSRFAAIAIVVSIAQIATAQTTLPGDAIDIEIYNPADGGNTFCVAPAEIFEPRVFLRPGTGAVTCGLSCSPPDISGGSANIGTAVIDIAFDPAFVSYVPGTIQNNTATAAVQGMTQEQNVADNRIGWALAGTWSSPGDPASTLMSPCDTQLLTTAGWLYQLQFQADGTGMSTLRLRRETDARPFALSFADLCGTPAFKESNGGIHEVKSAIVMVSSDCGNVVFFDNFENGDTSRWVD